MSLDLFVTRAGVYPRSYLGYLVVVPPVPAAEGVPVAALAAAGEVTHAMEDALFGDLLAGIGKPARLIPFGLVEPTAWERRFVAWVARRIGVAPEAGWETPAERDPNPAFAPLAAALADPLAAAPQPSPAIQLIECDDPELEALAAARRIREWLAPQPAERWAEAVDEVLVLLPASPERRAIWKRVLEKHGVAADVPGYSPLVTFPLGRWLLSLARLARWRKEPVHRDHLRAALLGVFVTMPEGARRSDLRDCLRSLRVHRVSFPLWQDHLGQWKESKEEEIRAKELGTDEQAAALDAVARRHQGLTGLSVLVADQLASGETLFRGLSALLDELGAANRVRASGVAQAVDALERARRILQRLGEEELAHPREPLREKLGELERRLAETSLRSSGAVRHGVRIASYAQYDGQRPRFLVLAGLEEGGHPRAPGRPSRAEADLAARLGLGTPEDELARQARIAAMAASRAREQVVLSWSGADEAGSDTFAGPLLAAIRGRKGHPGLSAARFGPAQASPQEAADVASPGDLLAVPVAAVGSALPDGALRVAWNRAKAASDHAALVDEARAPTSPTALGPYTGKVGLSLGAKRYSPTALESLGQCASRYYLERVLGVEETGDASVDLDAMETGSMLHEALALAAQAAIEKEGAWALAADDAVRGAHVLKVAKRLATELEGAASRYIEQHPTLPAALVKRVAGRWKKVLDAWLASEAARPQGGVFPVVGEPDPAKLDAEDLDAIAARSPEVAEALAAYRRLDLAGTLALLESGRAAPAANASAAGRAYDNSTATNALLTKKAFGEVATTKAKGAREKMIAALAEEARRKAEQKRKALHDAILAIWRTDRLEVPRRVIASEWSFGDKIPPGADPRSTSEPLVIDLSPGRRVEVRGRVDRVDAAEDRPDAAVVDYKSGRSKSAPELLREFGEGRHLQLPLYAAAVAKLLVKDIVHPLHVVRGRLDFLRSGKQPGLVFEPGLQSVLVRPGQDGSEPVAIDDIVKAHLAHAIGRLESGVVPLLPRACPHEIETAHCACQVVCGFRPEAREMFLASDTQPRFVPRAKAGKGGAGPAGDVEVQVDYQKAAPVEDPPPHDKAKKAHEDAQRRACDVDRDVVVSAGAGSGKTSALVDRYCKALEPGCGPENVLCITFTRKATAEMRSRIRDSLLAMAGGARDQSAMRAWITALGTAPIQTIDAFAACVVTGLSEAEVVLSDAAGGFATEFVAERMALEAKRPSEDLDLLLRELPVPALRSALAGLLDEPRLGSMKLSAKAIVQGWDDEATRLAGDLAERISDVVGRARKAAKGDENASKTLELALEGLAVTESAFDDYGTIAGLWALSRVKVGNAGSKSPAEDLKALKEEIKAIRGEAGDGWFRSAGGVLTECKTAKDVRAHLTREARIAHAAMEVARSWLVDYAKARDERRIASFSDILALATRTLAEKDPAEIRARFPFHHILVDEFQDTDDAQLGFIRLLQERLSKGGRRPSLFVVGDPKQSIYRFRGAEVDQFEEFWDGAPKASRASLTVCWRAEPELSCALSRLFGRLFDAKLDPAAAVPWEPLAPKGKPGKEPRIDLLLADEVGSEGPDGEEATSAIEGEVADPHDEEEKIPDDLGLEQALVRNVKSLLREADGGGGESPIAILTHSWARAIHYGQLLREHGVPAFVQGGRGLLDAREVRDVFQWLEAMERQDDDLVFAALLRGATVGLSDPGLYAIRKGAGLELRDFASEDGFLPAKNRNALSSIRHGFRFDAAKAIEAMERTSGAPLDPDVKDALKRDEVRLRLFAEAWALAAARFGLVPLSDVVEQIVRATAYEAVLRSRADGLQALANLRSFQDLVRAAESGRSPADAVREIERVASEGEDPAAAGFSLQPGAAVTLTVVHQAKGREWDTVIVPDLHRVKVKGRVTGCDLQRLVRRDGKAWERKYLPASLIENPADLLATMGGVGAKVLSAATRGAERAELRRLLYVACTRAKKRLVLTASWPDEEAFAKLAKKGKLGLSRSQSWFDDIVFGLQLQLGNDGQPFPGDGIWKVGRDFRWVRPEGDGFGDAEASTPALAKVNPAVVRLAAQAVLPEPLTIVNPSCAEAVDPVPEPMISRPAKAPPVLRDSPFASANEQGSAFHRTMQFWSYGGECTDSVIARAVKDVVGEWRLAERVARIRQLVDAQASCQPAFLTELREASARGEVFHEVSVGFLRDDGAWVEGAIDLLYRDVAGDWHVVDYKTDRVGDDAALRVKVAEYYPQVRAYADALNGQLPGDSGVTTMRLWMVGAGCVATWAARFPPK